MANTVNSNTIYIDSTGDISNTDSALIHQIIATSTASTAQAIIRDQAAGDPIKIDIREADANKTINFIFERPIQIATGINIGTLTNMVMTLVYTKNVGG